MALVGRSARLSCATLINAALNAVMSEHKSRRRRSFYSSSRNQRIPGARRRVSFGRLPSCLVAARIYNLANYLHARRRLVHSPRDISRGKPSHVSLSALGKNRLLDLFLRAEIYGSSDRRVVMEINLN